MKRDRWPGPWPGPANGDARDDGPPPHEPVVREMPLTIEGGPLPPHPDPLPKGEGESLPDLERQAILVCTQTGGASSLSPRERARVMGNKTLASPMRQMRAPSSR